MSHICVEKPSLTKLVPQYYDPDTDSFKILEYDTTYARGGRGNKKLVSWSYGHTKGNVEDKISLQKQDEIIKQTGIVTKPLFDYYDESTHPKEWNNIEQGSDIFKLTKRERNIIRLVFFTVSCGVIFGVVELIRMLF